MKKYANALKRAAKAYAEATGPGAFAVAGRQVVCLHCQGTEFDAERAQLNTSGMTTLGLHALNQWAHTLGCTECGRIEWFATAPERI